MLQRPYYKPSDVYAHIAQIHNLPDFVAKRTEAEAAARAKVANGEATIYEIYDELQEPYKALLDVELSLERDTLQVNPEILEVIDYAISLNKTVFLIADNYLPSSLVREVLLRHGVTTAMKIFISSEYREGKWNSNLFKKALEDVGSSI